MNVSELSKSCSADDEAKLSRQIKNFSVRYYKNRESNLTLYTLEIKSNRQIELALYLSVCLYLGKEIVW